MKKLKEKNSTDTINYIYEDCELNKVPGSIYDTVA